MTILPKSLDQPGLLAACNQLSGDPHLSRVLAEHGTPPLWDRPPGFATLLHIILEQQVSLASAKACFDKLEQRIGFVSPRGLLGLDDAELRSVGLSRQKANYARQLASAVISKRIDLDQLETLNDAEAAHELKRLNGIGQWTSDIYLLMALRRPDIMPKGDIALHTAWHKLSGEPRPTSDEFVTLAERWKPYRSTAARLLWHFYLSERKGKRN